MPAVLISIKPKRCELIANGQETVEVRKTRPKLETPFKCYIYCTKAPNGWVRLDKNVQLDTKVIGEFVCDRIYQYSSANVKGIDISDEDMIRFSCLSKMELCDYETSAEPKEGCIYLVGLYGWHISDLKIYDKPKELTEFNHTNEYIVNLRKSLPHWEYGIDDECVKPIRNPPQSWCYVEEVRE